MKKILVIAYIFPPRGGSGVQRTLKFIKYLPDFNWDIFVLTAKNKPAYEKDETLLKELPKNIKIYRTQNLISEGEVKSEKEKKGFDLKKKISNFILNYLLLPDYIIGWFPLTLLKGIKIIKNEKIDIIYSTSYPFTDHLIGYFLKKITRKPWVSDFRDPWSDFAPYIFDSKNRNKINSYLEKKFIKESDKVIVTCEELKKFWDKKYNIKNEEKITVITNGYDKNDFNNIKKDKQKLKKLTIVFTGRFNNEMNASITFFKALSNIENNYDKKYKDKIQFKLVGSSGDLSNILRKYKINDVVDCTGYVPHKKSIEYLYSADILLLTRAEGKGINLTLPGKLFEYIVTKKPILALVMKGATSKFIKKYDLGCVIKPNDINEIEKFLIDLINKEKINFEYNIDTEKFERKYLTKILSENLEKIINEN